MKKFIHFIKSNKIGSTAIEAMVIVPLWLLTIIFIGRTLIISNSRYSLAHESLPIGNIISQSRKKTEAVADIEKYIKLNNVKGINTGDIEMCWVAKNGKLVDDWEDAKAGDVVRVKITINTPFDDMRFSSMEIGGQTIEFFPPKFTNEFTVVLSYK